MGDGFVIEVTDGKTNSKKARTYKDCNFLTGLLLAVLGVALLVAIILLWVKTTAVEVNGRFSIVFDVGGSGTRMYVYEYTSGKMNQVLYVSCEKKGATNQDLSSLQQKMIECVEKAKQEVPQQIVSKVPVYMGATAGMRLVKYSNKTKYDSIWETLATVLKNSSLRVRYNNTLPGTKEASYSWATINELQSNETFLAGLFEVGSSSLQIAFDVEDDTTVHNPDEELVRRKGKEYNLHAKSYLCYGITEFSRRFKAELAKKAISEGSNATNDPCSYGGHRSNLSISYFSQQPCIDGALGEKTFGEKIVVGTKDPSYHLVFNGTGNFSSCLKQVQYALRNGTHRTSTYPTEEDFFMGVGGGTVYASQFLGLPEPTNISSYKQATERLCDMKLKQVKNLSNFNKHVLDYCLAATYSYTILKDIIKLGDQDKILFAKKINGKKVSWTLGLAVNHINEMSRAIFRDEHRISQTLFIIILCVSILLILFGIVQLIRYMRNCRERTREKKLEESHKLNGR